MRDFLFGFPAGRITPNWAEVTLLDNTEAIREITVPTGETWLLMYGHVSNGDDVARDVEVRIYDSSGHTISGLAYETVNAGDYTVYPNHDANNKSLASGVIVLMEGYKIKIIWKAGGSSSGGTAKSTAVVLAIG